MALWRRVPFWRRSLMARGCRRRCQICRRRPGERVLCMMGCGKKVGPGCCLFAELPHRFGPNNQRAGCCVACAYQNQCRPEAMPEPEPMPEPMPTDLDALNFASEGLRHIPVNILTYLGSPNHQWLNCVNAFARASTAAHRWYYFRFDGGAVAGTSE